MPSTATLDPPLDEAILDQLVPPPGPRWRRAARWSAFLGVVGVIVWAAASGTIVPQVSTNVEMWGGAGPVGITTSVTNGSPVAIEIVNGPAAPSGLHALGSTTGPLTTDGMVPTTKPGDPFPLRLEPGDSVDLTTWFRVDACGAVRAAAPDDQIDIEVRIASGPASRFTATRTIDATTVAVDEAGDPASWGAGIAQHVCPT